MNSTRLYAASVAILIAAAFRLVPHPMNMSPIAAMALFAGAELTGRRWAVAIPLAAMLLSDALIGFHSLMPAVYGAFALTVFLGRGLLRSDSPRASTYAAASVASSLAFFGITNFAVWFEGSGVVYPATASGLAACYVAGLPFLQNALVGDLLFTGVLFGTWRLAVPHLSRVSV